MAGGAMPRFVLDGAPAFGFAGTGTFAEEVVLPSQGVVKIDDDVPWDIASLIGCGVTTGVGAAINSAKVVPGSSVVVFGLNLYEETMNMGVPGPRGDAHTDPGVRGVSSHWVSEFVPLSTRMPTLNFVASRSWTAT